MKLSIVTTIYRAAGEINELCDRLARSAVALVQDDYELVLVDDCSEDDSLDVALRRTAVDPRIIVVELARRQGQYPAILAGLAECAGERVFLIDGDLEEPPELLEQFWSVMERAHGEIDVAVGVQEPRRGSVGDRMVASIFYRMLSVAGQVPILRDNVVARLMSREYVRALLSLNERPLSFDVHAALPGFRQVAVPVQKTRKRRSTYSPWSRLAVGTRAIAAYSNWPVLAIGIVGAGAAVTAVALFVVAGLSGPPDRMWLLAGLMTALTAAVLFAMSILGLYIVLVLNEVRRRPVMVRRVHRSARCEETT